tara:strand:- start:8636 stop:10198 length:1563 start_codon:yes stop_codon:yes gene_type:complete
MDLKTAYIVSTKVKGAKELTSLKKSLKGVSEQTNKAAGAFSRLKKAGSGLMGVLGSLGATAAVSGFLKAGIDMQRTSKTLKVLTSEFNEHEKVLGFVDVAADRFGLSQQRATKGVSDLFARLRPMGIGLEQIKDVYLGINNAALRYNLSAADTEGVMLQLSQALGSGVLQGDEFRSVMERLPAVGQAIAETMGVTVGELKQLSSDGMLTTDKIIEAMAKLRNAEAPKPDAFKLYRKAMENLSTTIGTKLLPAFTPLIQAVNVVLNWFNKLPGPVQTVIAGFTALAAGIVIIAPALGILSTGFGALVAVLGVVAGAAAAIPIGMAAIGAAAIALGVLIYKFRSQIAQAFSTLGEILTAPFRLMITFVQRNLGVVLGPINAIMRAARRAAAALTSLFRKRSRAKSTRSSREKNAEGGFVSGAQLSWVGERGGEYIVPTGKAGAFAKNYMAGFRGSSAIPRNAEGGYVPSNASVNITTGPVQQMGGTNYVTTTEMSRAVQSGVRQTLDLLRSDMNLRQSMGIV